MMSFVALSGTDVVVARMATLGTLDWVEILIYFCILAAVVFATAHKNRTASDYFLGGRAIGWFAIGCSIFASNIGSEHIVGLAGQGASSGLTFAHFEFSTWIILILGWIFAPFFYQTGIFTTPEYLEKRFNSTCRWILSIIFLVGYIFTKVSVTVYAGAVVFQVLLPDTFGSPENAFWIGAVATVVLTGIYTVFGGLRTVLYTDSVQAILLLLGSIFITVSGILHLDGGWASVQQYAAMNAEKFTLWHPATDPSYPWPGMLVATFIIGIWYYCTDQYIVQRTLAANNIAISRRSAIWASVLKLAPVLLFIVPGLIGATLYYQGRLPIPVDANGKACFDNIYPTMVVTLAPQGIRGIIVVSLLSALMSSLSSIFNSTAALFVCDIYPKFKRNIKQHEMVVVGKLVTMLVTLIGLIWIPIMPLIAKGGLYDYIQSVQSFLAPSIMAIFVAGIFIPRINGTGAVWGLSVGFALGMIKMALQGIYGRSTATGILSAIGKFSAYYTSGVLLVVTLAIMAIVSYCTAAPDPQKISGYTLAHIDRTAFQKGITRWDIFWTAAVLLLTLGIYTYFTLWI